MTKCAFGSLNVRWKILLLPMGSPVEKLPNTIYACFVLYNFCEGTKDEENANFVDKQQEERHGQLIVNKLYLYSSTSLFINNCNIDLLQDFCPDIQ